MIRLIIKLGDSSMPQSIIKKEENNKNKEKGFKEIDQVFKGN